MLFRSLIEAHAEGQPFQITGTDWPTRDGSGIRDYIHVWDLAAAHVSALQRFDGIVSGPTHANVVNLGTGTGTTVRELVTAFNGVVSSPVTVVETGPRPGDAAGAFTRSERAKRQLGWEPRLSIADGIRSALRWAAIRDERLPAEA